MSTAEQVATEKRRAAEAAMEWIRDGMTVGLGSGSTALCFIETLGRRVREGLRVTGVPTSRSSREAAGRWGIPLVEAGEVEAIDVTVDGADEIDPRLNLIKGGGGALLWEKIVAANSRELVIIADSRKWVQQLGAFPLPVEVVRFGWTWTARAVSRLGAQVTQRTTESGRPFLTDEGHYILDCRFGTIEEPERLSAALNAIPGVVEHGLFIGLASAVLIGRGGRVEIIRRNHGSLAATGNQPVAP
ncbi:MAG: ribose-5-phosphate isomerase RpiA [Acidobacteriota bacterium]